MVGKIKLCKKKENKKKFYQETRSKWAKLIVPFFSVVVLVQCINMEDVPRHKKIFEFFFFIIMLDLFNTLPRLIIAWEGMICIWVYPLLVFASKIAITSSGESAVFSITVSSIDKIWSPTDNAPHLEMLKRNLNWRMLKFQRLGGLQSF